MRKKKENMPNIFGNNFNNKNKNGNNQDKIYGLKKEDQKNIQKNLININNNNVHNSKIIEKNEK